MYFVLRDPAPLAGMALPDAATDWQALYDAGLRHVVRLHPAAYDPAPLRLAHDGALEDQLGRAEPSDPVAERERVLAAAAVAADLVARGEGVVVHCHGGTGRTGTVLGCALRELGFDPEEAAATIKAQRPAWPESRWQAELVSR